MAKFFYNGRQVSVSLPNNDRALPLIRAMKLAMPETPVAVAPPDPVEIPAVVAAEPVSAPVEIVLPKAEPETPSVPEVVVTKEDVVVSPLVETPAVAAATSEEVVVDTTTLFTDTRRKRRK